MFWWKDNLITYMYSEWYYYKQNIIKICKWKCILHININIKFFIYIEWLFIYIKTIFFFLETNIKYAKEIEKNVFNRRNFKGNYNISSCAVFESDIKIEYKIDIYAAINTLYIYYIILYFAFCFAVLLCRTTYERANSTKILVK